MENLKNEIPSNIDFQNLLVRIVDIVNFEGPILTLFENRENKHIYLLDWVDSDADFNRWLLYRTNATTLHKFINGLVSHYDLLMANEPFCHAIDIDTHLNWNNQKKVQKKDLPQNYAPKKDVFFDEYDCPNLGSLEAYIFLARESEIQENKMLVFQ